jgi:hypothetical protein
MYPIKLSNIQPAGRVLLNWVFLMVLMILLAGLLDLGRLSSLYCPERALRRSALYRFDNPTALSSIESR